MVKLLEKIFETKTIEINDSGERIPLHSNTTKEQGLFLQEIFELVRPTKSLEVGFAYGISTLFILEKHQELNSQEGAHISIEPDQYWGNTAEYNIKKAGFSQYLRVERDFSDKVLTRLFHENYRIQYAYIDTTKLFDVVLQDFYFIDKLLDIGGVVILDDCGGTWPGVQRVARYINTLPHYEKLAGHSKIKRTFKRKVFDFVANLIFRSIPFKHRLFPTINIKSDRELGLDYRCIAFQKKDLDKRSWNWDRSF